MFFQSCCLISEVMKMKMLILIDENGNQIKGVVPHILKDDEELEKTIFDFNDNYGRITTENPSEGC